MEQKVEKMYAWFEEQISGCGRREQELLADERKDEAILEKVRANIYDVVRTWLKVGVRINQDHPEEGRKFFVQRMEQIPLSWSAAYDKAKEYNDPVRMQTEQVKLDAARESYETFKKIWEEEA